MLLQPGELFFGLQNHIFQFHPFSYRFSKRKKHTSKI